MDDDGSKSLDYSEFKKGIHDYGLTMEDAVSNHLWKDCAVCLYAKGALRTGIVHFSSCLGVQDI